MGSKGFVSLAHMAYSTTIAGNANELSQSTEVLETASYKYSMLILFCVSVPVLSTHITVAEPRVSTYCGCFTTILFRNKRKAPNAWKVLKATGISSGSILIASVNPCKKDLMRSLD